MEDLIIYTTTQTHSLGLKAGLVLGLNVRALEVRAEDQFALRGETLRQALEDDEKQGKRPFILSQYLIYIRYAQALLYLKLQLWVQRHRERLIISRRFNRSVGQMLLIYYLTLIYLET